MTFDDRLHVAPLTAQTHRVLDAGCGTGVWSIEYGTWTLDPRLLESRQRRAGADDSLADEHPESHVTGVDLSPIQPAL